MAARLHTDRRPDSDANSDGNTNTACGADIGVECKRIER